MTKAYRQYNYKFYTDYSRISIKIYFIISGQKDYKSLIFDKMYIFFHAFHCMDVDCINLPCFLDGLMYT